ncbi:hypothetical protein A3A93_04470 [Candidatus Roizmanbacteria bacterium RIFCSPLOWO2_01_FULL_38_12]|uniref:Uncharacterized protein n=1 Tax=Candidatus Roizmanbacteria bacterium RIFCSPLOWO2_01_FULL_38_12 TaxID=1802061 RepID=A0A1F7IXF4_9BACT|nr:MAG: hypothetical protein A2861_01940 [Candidatus Roizmanbacteria bacterium RIFCSPHIGHO2_01_FULL_38_15]OGK35494.1 MAG: hypothetical protein A3F59_00970 [Candidatus Roizmanbacteria bacterium RIFCSPHIGHO2_12_FULL_38_13]OGK48024.1 MAG: hypothetical protein A3A93_04470 [Candidatus Roizmanbacteria bacterium RIFCSPLOWO2_01_FULL_38_12]
MSVHKNEFVQPNEANLGQSNITSTQMDQENPDEFALTFQPIFSNDEVEGIKKLWAQQQLQEDERLLQLQSEEERIRGLLESERGRNLIEEYDRGGLRRTLNIKSKDDCIVVFRHRLDKEIQRRQESSTDQDFNPRDMLLKLHAQDFSQIGFNWIFSRFNNEFSHFASIIQASYPGSDLRSWEFHKTPSGFYSEGLLITTIRWFYETYLNLDKTEPNLFREGLLKVRINSLNRFGIRSMIKKAGYRYRSGAVIDTYPELKLQPWEFLHGVRWSGKEGENTIKQAVKWLIEERLGISPEDPDFKDKLRLVTARTFSQAGLFPLLNAPSFKSHIKAIIFAYEELGLTIDDFARVPAGTWEGDAGLKKAIEVIRHRIEIELGISPNDPEFATKIRALKRSDLLQSGTNTPFTKLFNASLIKVINTIYPYLELQPWELGVVPRGFWAENEFENVRSAIKWFVEEQLGLSQQDENFKSKILNLRKEELIEYFGGMFATTKLTLLQVLQIAYPELWISNIDFIKANKYRDPSTLSKKFEQADQDTTEAANEWLQNLLGE